MSGSDLASSRRVRAICDNLERLGIITAALDYGNRRDKPLRINGWLEPALRYWVNIRVHAARPWLEPTQSDAQLSLSRYFECRTELDRYGFDLAEDLPVVRFFLERSAGYPIMLELFHASPLSRGPSRKALARTYGVSRPHVAVLVARAIKEHWLRSGSGGEKPIFTSATNLVIRRWIARELAFTVVAFH